MKGTLQIAVTAIVAMLIVAGTAQAAEGGPSRDEYVALVEPICEANTAANDRILRNVRDKVRNDKLNAAGNQFIRASDAFRRTVGEIAAVPRPPADDARLIRWFGFLEIVAANLRHLGKALLDGDKIKAAHESVRVERSGNAANNVGFVFGFVYCRITPSRFS